MLKDKIIRLVIPAVLWWALWTLWSSGHVYFAGILNYEYWFTLALFLYFIAFMVQRSLIDGFLKIIRKPSATRLEALLHILLTVAAFYILTDALPRLFPILNYKLVDIRMRMSCLYPYLVIGFLIGRLKLLSYFTKDWVGALSFVGLILSVAYLRTHTTEEVPYIHYGLWHMYRFMTLSLFVFLVYALGYLTESSSRIGKALVWLGQRSLPIYFVHYFFLPIIPGSGAYLIAIDPTARVTLELVAGGIGVLATLAPTLSVVWAMRLNPYIDFFFFGEKARLLPPQRSK